MRAKVRVRAVVRWIGGAAVRRCGAVLHGAYMVRCGAGVGWEVWGGGGDGRSEASGDVCGGCVCVGGVEGGGGGVGGREGWGVGGRRLEKSIRCSCDTSDK